MYDVIDKFEINVQNNPNALCICTNNIELTYKQFWDIVNRYFEEINSVYKPKRILIDSRKSIHAIAAMFAALKAKIVYCVLNQDVSILNRQRIISTYSPDMIFVSSVDGHLSGVSCGKDVNKESLGDKLEAAAYVIFTSGSTGVPKGVIISRQSLNHFCKNALGELQISMEDRLSQYPELSFDLSVVDVFGALTNGASLHLITKQFDKLAPASFIKNNGITIWNCVPTVLKQLQKQAKLTKIDLSSLRKINVCGENLSATDAAWILENANVKLYNTYGPTEATVSMTFVELDQKNYKNHIFKGSVEIGLPTIGMDFGKIINDNVFLSYAELNDGDEFEGVIVGEQVGQGYLNDIHLTDQKFISVSNGFTHASVRGYITGDLFVKHNGMLFFLNRIDNQVKIKGNRVELGSIESAVFEAGFGACVVLYINGIVTIFSEILKLEQIGLLDAAMKEILPTYMFPINYRCIDKFPRNTSDKIDMTQLACY